MMQARGSRGQSALAVAARLLLFASFWSLSALRSTLVLGQADVIAGTDRGRTLEGEPLDTELFESTATTNDGEGPERQVKLGGRVANYAEKNGHRIEECLNEPDADDANTYDDFLNGKPARLKPELVVLSRLPRRLPVTIITTYTLKRLYMLDGLCKTWRGAISAAIHHPRELGRSGDVEFARQMVQTLHTNLETRGRCNADILLFSELIEANSTARALFPVNSLRNRALVAAQTELIFILDGDLLVSGTLPFQLRTPRSQRAIMQMCRQKVYYVIPALEFSMKLKNQLATLYGERSGDLRKAFKQMASNLTRLDKPTVVRMLQEDMLQPFNFGTFDGGHGPTDYPRWVNSTAAYQVEYQFPYEPWGLMSRRASPWFDVRFRGYGKNKVIFLQSLQFLNFTFMVHPNHWVVHRHHPSSKDKKWFMDEKKGYREGNFFQTVDDILSESFKAMKGGTYDPVADMPTRRCKAVLPWWRPSRPQKQSTGRELRQPVAAQ